MDITFGQKFNPTFPRRLKSCDSSGCGYYPATLGGTFNAGIDLQVTSSTVTSPFSGYIGRFNSSFLPDSVQSDYFNTTASSNSNYSSSNAVILVPAETSHTGVYIILSNLVPISGIGHELQFFTSNDTLGHATGGHLHIEVIKEIDGLGYRLDPTPYLQPILEPTVGVELECNDLVMCVGGVVVSRDVLIESPVADVLGSPLITGMEDPKICTEL